MPYKSINELPKQAKNNLPKHAQEIYKEAYNSAWEEYKDPKDRKDDSSREEVAHKVAWAAVKNVYEKNNKENWVKK
ncbi:MAG: cation transport regulator ChaB [Arcobacter sp.]|uniref:ChaB family protein n=1 Tax=uncultured Arcobacter sp. TaxID=165434 RepID=UPI000CAAA716|nr:ChaB family protein [uncultured Arcobacter sp.]PLY11534.1 MAG: cation transport regulator ChaB [Arcobacter sp.]